MRAQSRCSLNPRSRRGRAQSWDVLLSFSALGAAAKASAESFSPVLDYGHGSGGGQDGGCGGGQGSDGWSGGGDGEEPGQESERHAGDRGACCEAVEDVVLLEVLGMHCGSCLGRVRRLLEAQPHVAAASVSLATETALVRIAIPPLPLATGAIQDPPFACRLFLLKKRSLVCSEQLL